MRILLLSSRHSTYGAQVLRAALQKKLDIVAVIIEHRRSRRTWRRCRRYVRTCGLPAVLVRGIELIYERLLDTLHINEPLQTIEDAAQCERIPCEQVESLNTATARRIVASYQPALGLLGGTGILKTETIQQFSLGILNAHHGLLPGYRGNYCNRWALLQGDRLGISVYLLDSGLDTGPILSTWIVDLLAGEGLSQLDRRLTSLSAAFLADTAACYLSGQLVPQLQAAEHGKLYTLPRARQMLVLHWKLRRAARNGGRHIGRRGLQTG